MTDARPSATPDWTARALGISKQRFAHGAEVQALDGRILLSSYHCSRQNTNTGKLTRVMFDSVFEMALLRRPR